VEVGKPAETKRGLMPGGPIQEETMSIYELYKDHKLQPSNTKIARAVAKKARKIRWLL
jgi:hypothetical protein